MVKWDGYYAKKILDLLPSDGSWIRAEELKRKANELPISSRYLYKYLPKLAARGFIRKKIEDDSETYPRPVYYRVSLNPFRLEVIEILERRGVEEKTLEQIVQLWCNLQYHLVTFLCDYFDPKEFNDIIDLFSDEVLQSAKGLVSRLKIAGVYEKPAMRA